ERRFGRTVGQVFDRGGILFVIPRIPLYHERYVLDKHGEGCEVGKQRDFTCAMLPERVTFLCCRLDVGFRGIVCGSHILSLQNSNWVEWFNPFDPSCWEVQPPAGGSTAASYVSRPRPAVAPPELKFRSSPRGATTELGLELGESSKLCKVQKFSSFVLQRTSPIPWAVNSEIYPEAYRGIYGGMFRLPP
ncbi:unnamed protein product, partial [Musa acuminata var. zebrina]